MTLRIVRLDPGSSREPQCYDGSPAGFVSYSAP